MEKRNKPKTASGYGVPDNDIPEMMIKDFRRAKRVSEVMPDIVVAAKRVRGRPKP